MTDIAAKWRLADCNLGREAPLPPFNWPGSRRSLVALLLIVTAAAAIRVHLFTGYVGLDDAEYARFAYRLTHGSLLVDDYQGPGIFATRIGVIAPTAVLFRVFGFGEQTMVAFPFVVSMLSILLIYVCARVVMGEWAGLIAAGILAVLPLDIDCATKLLPDLPSAFFAAAAMTLVLAAMHLQWDVRRAFLAGTGAGLSLGLAWLCKESVAYLAPFCAVLIVAQARENPTRALALWSGVVLASFAVLAAEMTAYHWLRGDLLYRVHEVERDYRQWQNGFFTEGSNVGWQQGEDYRHALLRRLFVTGPAMLLLNKTLLYLPFVCVGVTAYAIWRRERTLAVPLLWFWSVGLMFNFGSSSVTSYIPLALYERYLYLLFFPMIVVVAGFIAGTVVPATRARAVGAPLRLAGVCAALFVFALAGRQLLTNVRHPPTWWMGDTRVVKAQVTPDTRIYADALSLRAFEFFEAYPAATAWSDFTGIRSLDAIGAGSLVLINPANIEWLDRNGGMWVAWPSPGPTPRWSGYARHLSYRHVPPQWTLIWRNHDVALYLASTPTS